MKRARRRRGLPALLSVLLLCCAQAAQAQVAVDTLARDPRLLALAGWQDAPLRPWRTRNVFTDRRATHDELASRRRFVADNLDLYVHDPRYACRRPALARWFHDRLQHPPLATAHCDPALPFVRADGSDAPLLRLDPARVYAVDYLLAEGNAQPMSRWGHSMLRLVVCAPGRAPGPDCRLDLGEHVVLSFRAFVDDVQVSSWRGLTGSYPSRLFVLPLAQVVTEYTEIELRGLRSIPLQLSRAEIAGLLQRAAQVHWAYDGRYAFIGNNCAVETARLLQDGVPRLAGAHLMSITPTGLLRRLERAGIADDSVLDDRAEAVRLGYSFEAADAHQAEIFAVARERLALPAADAAAWLDQPAARRGGPIAHADRRAAAALLLLEQQALRRLELRARDALKHRLGGDRHEAVRGLLELEARLTRPATLLPGPGYGIPQPSELATLEANSAQLAERLQGERDALLAQARAWLPPALRAELDGTEANLAQLQVRLQALEGGEKLLDGL